MPNQPPELNAQDVVSEQEVSSDAAQTINCKRAAILLSLILSALPADALAKNQSSTQDRDFSSFVFHMNEKAPFMNWEELIQMSWEEMEKKLKIMSCSEQKQVLDLLSEVSTDARLIGRSRIGDQLKQNELLSENKKEFLLVMAKKYGVDDLSTLKIILDQNQLAPSDFRYVLLKLKEIIGKQRHAAELYVQIRDWLPENVSISNILDPGEEFIDLMEGNTESILVFKNLIRVLANYERWLGN